MLSRQDLEKSPLFRNIRYEEYDRMMDCFHAKQQSFGEGACIYSFSDSAANVVGVIARGSAALVRIDEEGTETVLEELPVGGVFGRTLAFAAVHGDSLEVVSRTPCEVTFFDYACVLKRCDKACGHHSMFVQNVLEMMANKAQALSERVDVLSRRSIREKLLCSFQQLAEKAGGDTFTLPFSLSVLADYIATDRSAMMRELRRLREEQVVKSTGRTFQLSLDK